VVQYSCSSSLPLYPCPSMCLLLCVSLRQSVIQNLSCARFSPLLSSLVSLLSYWCTASCSFTTKVRSHSVQLIAYYVEVLGLCFMAVAIQTRLWQTFLLKVSFWLTLFPLFPSLSSSHADGVRPASSTEEYSVPDSMVGLSECSPTASVSAI